MPRRNLRLVDFIPGGAYNGTIQTGHPPKKGGTRHVRRFFSGDGFISIFFLLFIVAFVAILGMILVTFVRELSQRNRNNHSPRLTVEATVVAKRQSFSSHRSGGEMHTTTSTRYFATFQVESGDRMELQMNGQDYGMLVEGDRGRLTFQGTRYLDFQRM